MLVLDRYLYFGPNRRSPKTVIEWVIGLEPAEATTVQRHARHAARLVCRRIADAGLDPGPELERSLESAGNTDSAPVARLCRLAGIVAVALQRATGHDVTFTDVVPDRDPERRRLVFEYEHSDTGADAGDIAMRLLAEAIPGLRWEADSEVPGEDTAEALRLFAARSPAFVLPGDCRAIIAAAARLDVPCVKLEREPYRGVAGEFRLRPNGLLKLGHACRTQIVDGTLCLERSAALAPLVFDRERLWAVMDRLGLPLAEQDPSSRPLTMTKKILRTAERLGYPVILKPVRRRAAEPRNYVHPRPPLHDERALLQELARLRSTSTQVQVEKFLEGDTWHVLVAGGQAICAVQGPTIHIAIETVHASTIALAERAARELDCGLLVLTIVVRDPSRSLEDQGGRVVDLDPAPQLDRLLPAGLPWLDIAAERFVRWLYPEGTPARIPLIAVTGTNGKTTTCRLLARIAKTAGHTAGMASTAGFYVDERLREGGDLAGVGGHHLLFESRDVDFGVLETARGGVAHTGFMFDHCDAAVCLNVSPEHLGEFGIETLEDMVAIKRSVLERATRGVVLNADYATCLQMLPFGPDIRVGLCSLTAAGPDLLQRAGAGGIACVLEEGSEGEAGGEWLVCHEAGRRAAVMPVAEFPAALGGAARFNLSNAQHAILAARLMGFDFQTIARALRSFRADYETNPGRLNVCLDHPFTVIMDYAHNPDGMEQLLDCVDRMQIAGRRILMYAATGNRTDAEVAAHTVFPVGRVDHFVVRRYPSKLRGRRPDEIPTLMRAALLDAGVPAERITVADPPEDGAVIAMRLAQPGDVVIVSPGTEEFDRMWEQVTSFEPRAPAGI